jgi:hypothetical protein
MQWLKCHNGVRNYECRSVTSSALRCNNDHTEMIRVKFITPANYGTRFLKAINKVHPQITVWVFHFSWSCPGPE